MTKKKAKRTAEKPKYVPTVAERAAIETTLARLKSTTTPWLKIENGQLRHDHPDEVVGSILLQNAFASADVSFWQLARANLVSEAEAVSEAALNFAVAVVNGMQPRDQVEAMLQHRWLRCMWRP